MIIETNKRKRILTKNNFVSVRVGTSNKYYTLNINKQNFKESNQFKKQFKKSCIWLFLHLHHEDWGKGWVFSFERMFVCHMNLPGNSFPNFQGKFQGGLANWPHHVRHAGHGTCSACSESCFQPASAGTHTSSHKGNTHPSSHPHRQPEGILWN